MAYLTRRQEPVEAMRSLSGRGSATILAAIFLFGATVPALADDDDDDDDRRKRSGKIERVERAPHPIGRYVVCDDDDDDDCRTVRRGAVKAWRGDDDDDRWDD